MKLKIKILNIIATLLIIFEVLAYIGAYDNSPIEEKGMDAIAYYIGFNIFLIIAIILFTISFYLKRKLKQNNEEDLINSIGKNE